MNVGQREEPIAAVAAPAPVQASATPVPAIAGRVLLFTYAFPPIRVQMTPAVIKPMAALTRRGYAVDVLCAAPLSSLLGHDDSLVPYAASHFQRITRLTPPARALSRILKRPYLLAWMPDP